jgi:hypothetical protein
VVLPNRILREGILTSRPVDRLSSGAEIFYRRLMSRLDDYGRCDADAELLRTSCYPLRVDKVKGRHIQGWLEECRAVGLLVIYRDAGKTYLQYLKFKQQERTESKFPAPDKQLLADAEQMMANAHLVVGVVVGVGGAEPGKPARAINGHRKAKTALPTDFGVSERVARWAEGRYFNLDKHLESFKRKCEAKDYRYVDWDSAFMEAVTKDWAGIGDGKKRVAL